VKAPRTQAALLLAVVTLMLVPLATAANDCHPSAFADVDSNCDGKTLVYCTEEYFLDQYTNALVTGFTVHENGTYSLVGEPGFDQPDGIREDFFRFIDGGGTGVCQGGLRAGYPCEPPGGPSPDCPTDPPSSFYWYCASAPDGVAHFDPNLVGQVITAAGQYGDLSNSDFVEYFPAGASGYPDATPVNPNCDRIAQDWWENCSLFFWDQETIAHSDVSIAASLEVLRGTVGAPSTEPGGVNLGPVLCMGIFPRGTLVVDPELPAPGGIFFYVTRMGDGSVYPYGHSGCMPRFVSLGNGACSEP
jgi:hypothetical protein